MEISNSPAPASQPHSKVWLVVTLVVAVVAAGLIWYFLYPKAEDLSTQTPESQKTVKNAVDETLVAAKNDLNTVNVEELKVAVDELKSTLDAFE
jgi:Tfp pilus assembly protein PilO